MGLTRIRPRTFWWVSQLGMLPGTAAYVYFGSTIPSLKVVAQQGVGDVFSWQLLVAFVIVGLLPLILKRIMNSWKTDQNSQGMPPPTSNLIESRDKQDKP